MLSLLLFGALALADPGALTHLMAIGSVAVVPGTFQGSHSSNESVLRVESGATLGTIRVIALKAGEADLFLAGDTVIHYQFVSNHVFDKVDHVRHLLDDVPGIKIEIVDGMIAIRGKPTNPSDAEKILTVQAAYVEDVLNLAVDNQKLCDTHICRYDPKLEPLVDLAPSNSWGVADPIVEAVRAATRNVASQPAHSKLKKLKKTRAISDPW